MKLKINPWIILFTGIITLAGCSGRYKDSVEIDVTAEIFPAYYNLTLPKNIAPLNFIIKEDGIKFRVVLTGENNGRITIKQNSPSIQIPVKKWKKLLADNSGNTIKIDIWAYHEKKWNKYQSIDHQVSLDTIDSYLVYRLVHAAYLKWDKMGIYQRNLTNFEESPIIENTAIDNGCVNCHSFSKYNPEKIMLHFRIIHPGTVIWKDGELKKINTATKETLSAGIYPAWSSDGKFIAFSSGKLNPHLTTRSNKPIDVADRVSDIIIYNTEKNTVMKVPQLTTNNRENLPVWSPDGKYLYYICAPEAQEGDDQSLLHSKYSLMRISYNPLSLEWGVPDTVLSADETGKSISMPAISPDGKFMLCSMSDYGYFTIFHKMSDIYWINLETGAYKRLELNSANAESYPKWSSNGKWLVFSSKRIDNVFTRSFIAHIDYQGNTSEPFVLPQKDPESYTYLLANYNRPELITGKVEISPLEIRDVVLSKAKPVNLEK